MNDTSAIGDDSTPAPTFDEVCAEVSRLDPQLRENSSTFKSAVVLLSALSVGQDVDALVQFTNYERDFVSLVAERMSKNGLWKDGNFVCSWMDESASEVAFWCDVLVAEGRASFSTNDGAGHDLSV